MIRSFESYKYEGDFRKDVNHYFDWMVNEGKYALGKFQALWDLAKKYPDKLLNMDQKNIFYGRILVPLHNSGIRPNPKDIDERTTLFSYLYTADDLGEYFKKIGKPIENFFEWYETPLEIYRGVPEETKITNLKEGQITSFTMKIEKAINFTDSDWVHRGYKNESNRKGHILVTKMKPKDTVLFNNTSGEFEVLVKGPLKYEKILKVKEGKLV